MKNLYRPFFLAVLLAPLWLACSDQDQPFELPLQQNGGAPVVAQVGVQIIFDSDVDVELRQMPAALQHLINTPEVRRRVEDILIRRAVLSQQAVVQGLDLKPDVFARIRRSRDDILIAALKKQYLSNLPLPSEASLRKYYHAHQHDFVIPEQIHAAHILLRTKEEAEVLYSTLKKDPTQFSDMAMKRSLDDSNSSRGGDLNWFPHGIMAKAFEDVAFSLKKEGDISEPIETNSGWHIIQLKGRKTGSMQTFDAAKKEIIHVLQHESVETWIASLVADANIRRNKQHNQESISIPEGLPPLRKHTGTPIETMEFSDKTAKEPLPIIQ
ncbi:MAG: peptidylprolyl isomerase [Mariprofundaceae bacterium]|nr:peptidylprolyl isomerase [Mariprofundaceae bacterium]